MHCSSLSHILPPISSHTSHPSILSKPLHHSLHPNPTHLKFIKKLAQGTFPVYLIYCPSTNQHLTMKIYPFQKHEPHPRFLNEIRFISLNHPNVNKILDYKVETRTVMKNQPVRVSYMVMEYAPYETFFEVFRVHNVPFNAKLARTYFQQMINGLEHLHEKGAAHLDLKLENLLVGENFVLKLADFDVSFIEGDQKVRTTGTICYRAPELVIGKCENPVAADIFSAGVLLFLFKSGGVLPFLEEKCVEGVNLMTMFYEDNQGFWKLHCKLQGKPANFFDDEFQELFNSMVTLEANSRASINEIKGSKWYNGPVYTEEEVCSIMKKYYRI